MEKACYDKNMNNRIWAVINDKTQRRTLFAKYADAIQSVRETFDLDDTMKFPEEKETTDMTRIGRTLPDGNWISINAVPLYQQVVAIA